MLTAKEAFDIFNKANPNKTICSMAEVDSMYIICPVGNDNNGYDTVDKITGEIGFIWVWDYADYVLEDKVKEIDISTFGNKGPDNNGPSVFRK